MAEAKIELPRPSSSNTPPNCAICLGPCINKCFSNSCMHQFCFQCLMEWSKIKAECPLCKQTFKSIIHNVKSNEEYDEYIVPMIRNENVPFLNEEYIVFPVPTVNDLTIQYRDVDEFHLRTTFTVDSRLEHAIQQMFMTGPITSGNRNTASSALSVLYHPHGRHHLPNYSTEYRRQVYEQDIWANGLPDLSGFYRDCSPVYFRTNRGTRQRLVPWLNRELTALLYEDTHLIMRVADLILEKLPRQHICSRSFHSMLQCYLHSKTDHFIHEFYNFMRSPYDMFGYDRNVIYTARNSVSPAPFIQDETVEVPDGSSDSDVVIVNASNQKDPVVIDLVDCSTDSDEPIMVSPNSQVPKPISLGNRAAPDIASSSYSYSRHGVNLPPKLRYKHKYLQEKEKKKKNKRKRQRSSSSSSSDSNRESRHMRRKYLKKMIKKIKNRRHSQTREDSDIEVDLGRDTNSSSDSENDDVPLINRFKVKSKDKKRSKRTDRSTQAGDEELNTNQYALRSSARPRHYHNYPLDGPIDLSANCSRYLNASPSCTRSMTSPSTVPEWSANSNTRNFNQITPPLTRTRSSESSTNRYHVELPTSARSKVKFTDNGQYTSVKIETSGSVTDTQNEPSSSRTKISIIRNGLHAATDYCRGVGGGQPEYESASSPDYRLPIVKSEIREVKYEHSAPSTSNTSHVRPQQICNKPLRLKKSGNLWFTIPDSDSTILSSSTYYDTTDSTTNNFFSGHFSTSSSD